MPHTNDWSTPVSALAPDMLTRLEFFLDSRSFGPGKIDGKAGEFVELALCRYQMTQGKESQPVDAELKQELKAIDPGQDQALAKKEAKFDQGPLFNSRAS